MERDESRPSLHFRIVPGSRNCTISLAADIPGRESGPVPCRGDLLPFAMALVRYRLEAVRRPRLAAVVVDESHFDGKGDLFRSAWHFVKNAMRDNPTVQAGRLLAAFQAWVLPREQRGRRYIEIDATRLPPANVSFGVVDAQGVQREPFTDREFTGLFQFMTGRLTAEELMMEIGAIVQPKSVFRFGSDSTKTTVVHTFRDGLSPDRIVCGLAGEAFAAPPEVESLIDRAHCVLRTDAPGVRKVADQPMLAPRRVDVSMAELDSGTVNVAILLADSSYRYYAAFAFAELLSNYSREFEPLLHFARQTPDPYQPAPATCSIGVRVLLETADGRLVVAHRSDQVKLNPDVWSVSANEGVRRNLLTPGRNCDDLLHLAVVRALNNELRLNAEECQRPVLLSIYRNDFNQWGAGFWVKSDLSWPDVLRRQSAARHAFEYRRIASLPIDVQACGRAMHELGERWYGGALETLCEALAWRELGSGRYIGPEEIGEALSRAAGGAVRPIDEANPALLPNRRSAASAGADPA